MAKFYMVYLPEAASQGAEHERSLKEKFGPSHVYPLKGSGAFAVKTDEKVHFPNFMDDIGFNEKGDRKGVAIEFDPTMINGWYNSSLWRFLSD